MKVATFESPCLTVLTERRRLLGGRNLLWLWLWLWLRRAARRLWPAVLLLLLALNLLRFTLSLLLLLANLLFARLLLAL